MTHQEFELKMKSHSDEFEKIWTEIVKDTNEFTKAFPELTMYSLKNVENFSDNLCLSGAWIQDRINGKMPKDRGSLTKKIRKALGFTVA